MRCIALTFVILVAALPAAADDGPIPLTVEVGATVSQKVGYAMGHLCDDTTIVRAEMKNGTKDDNLFVVTGLKPGTTLCRVGVQQNRPSLLFSVTVVERAAPRPSR